MIRLPGASNRSSGKELFMSNRSIVCALLAMLVIPALARAQFKQGDWELTLSGSGSTPSDVDAFSFGLQGSLGYFLADQLELGVRQAVAYTDVSGSSWNGSTNLFLDFHFDLGAFQPFIGANIGYVYGEGVHDTWQAGPEGGLKYFVNATTFIFGMVQYEFFFESGNDLQDEFSNGQFVYSLGIGFKF